MPYSYTIAMNGVSGRVTFKIPWNICSLCGHLLDTIFSDFDHEQCQELLTNSMAYGRSMQHAQGLSSNYYPEPNKPNSSY